MQKKASEMAEISQAMALDITEESLDGIEFGEIFNQMFNSEDEKTLEPNETKAVLSIQFKELTALFEEFSLQLTPEDLDNQREDGKSLRSFYDLVCLWQEQVASLITIQNMQVEGLQLDILEKDQMRMKLLADLKNQEETHLLEIEKVKQQFKLDVSYTNVIQNIRQMLEKHNMREKFLADLKNQKETHLLEIEKLKQHSKIEINNFTITLNMQSKYIQKMYKIQQNLITDLKTQQESHLFEIEKMKKLREQEFKVGCSLCMIPMTLSDGISCRYASLPCGHLFDDLCLRKHLTRQQTCPQCDVCASINDIRYIYVRTLTQQL